MKRTTVNVLIVLLLMSFLVATLLSLPRIDAVEADPYFHVNNTPVIYWIGFCLTVSVTLLIILSKKIGHGRYGLGFFSVMLSALYVYVIPKLFYVNPIYTDTYIFVGELLYTLRSGHVGWGHSYATPGLALFSSQFSLITGIDHIVVTEIISFVIPLITIFFVYVIAQFFANKRMALLACFLYISINWMNFVFSRQSFALMLQMFVIYGLFRVFSRRTVSLSWYVVIVFSYVALVFSHPLSSLFILTTPVFLVVFTCLVSLVKRILHKTVHGQISMRSLILRALLLSAVFSLVWLSWNISVDVNLYYTVQSIEETIQGLFININPSEHAGSIIPTYNPTYLPIANLRLFVLFFEAVVGMALASFALIKKKTDWKVIIISSLFISCMFISVFGLYGGWLQLLYRPFAYGFSIFSFLSAWFIMPKICNRSRGKSIRKMASTAIRGIILIGSIFFMLTLPLTMYSITPMMYPPTAYLRELDHVTMYNNGDVAIILSSSELGYYRLLNNASDTFTWTDNTANITDYSCIVTTFRAYTLDAFRVYDPPMSQSIMELEQNILNNSSYAFAKVYDGDSWHKIYVKQVGN